MFLCILISILSLHWTIALQGDCSKERCNEWAHNSCFWYHGSHPRCAVLFDCWLDPTQETLMFSCKQFRKTFRKQKIGSGRAYHRENKNKTQQQKSAPLCMIPIMPSHVFWLRCGFTVYSLFYFWGILYCRGSTAAAWIFLQPVISMSSAIRAQIRANTLWKTDGRACETHKLSIAGFYETPCLPTFGDTLVSYCLHLHCYHLCAKKRPMDFSMPVF